MMIEAEVFRQDDLLKRQITAIVNDLCPSDVQETNHIEEVLSWIDSGAELYRLKKPDFPKQHLVSYFVLYDEEKELILLGDHINAQKWLPSGGHVEPNEHPKDTVIRECREELNCDAIFLYDNPIFLSITETSGLTKGHRDVNLWYVLKGDSQSEVVFDKQEFKSVAWFHIDDTTLMNSDRHLPRFIQKLKTKFSN